MARESWWVLKFTKDGGVWAAQVPPSLTLATRHYLVDPTIGDVSEPRLTNSAEQTSQLESGDLVLANGRRAQIKNVLLSPSQGYIAQLFFIDTAKHGNAPLSQLSRIPGEQLEDPPLAQHFFLHGVSPHLPPEPRPQLNPGKGVGRVAVFEHHMWPDLVMNILKAVVGFSGDEDEVKVHVDMQPRDEIVVYCETTEGELNFNQYLIDTGFAVERRKVQSSAKLPSPEQLMLAVESFRQLELAVEPPNTPVEPVKKGTNLKKNLPSESIPYTYYKAYVESALHTKPCVSLEAAGFPGSVCKLLTRVGFQSPTIVQASTWPILHHHDRGLTVIVSPPNTGKTLAYLLPLVTKRELVMSREGVSHPRMVVVVHSSWGAEAVHTRAVQLMSAQSAHRRFKSCVAYKAQGKAILEILNGVEVLVCTPDCLLQLVEKTIAQLDSLIYLVLDNFEKLEKSFSAEISEILAVCSSSTCCGPVGVVLTASQWSQEIESVPTMISSHTHLCASPTHFIIACPVEATVRAGVKMDVIPCLEHGPDSILRQQLPNMSPGTVVCVATTETASSLTQQLRTLCFPVSVVSEGSRKNLEELFHKKIVVIVVDSAVPAMIQAGSLISHIIHYELPGNRAAFTSRLSLLYPVIHRGGWCCHTILLTERWRRQAGLVKEIMERMKQSPPQALLTMAQGLDEEREEKRVDYDLCYKLKAWGHCSDHVLCPYRHTHSTSPPSFPSPQPIHLPKDGSIKVKVSYVSTATRWWVSLLGHAPLYRGPEPVKPQDPDGEGLLKMSYDLAEYFTPERQMNTLQRVPAEGNYCALKNRDGCFYRVRILKFSQPLEFMFHHKEKALVRLIDVGEAKIVDVSQLLELPQHLLSPPPLVFEVFVCRVRPTDSDPDWPPQAAEIMEREYRNQTVHGRVALVSGETVWLHPVEKKVHHKGAGVVEVAVATSPQQQLKDARMGENNPTHLTDLANCLGLSLIRAENIINIDDPCVSFTSLKGSSVDVVISTVDSPNQFYLQPMETEQQVIDLENLLNQYEGVCSMVVQALPVGSVCAAQFSENRSWYRGCVLEVEGHESKIRFLDYGNVEWVMNHLVQPIHPSLLELPFQAICATFGMEDTEWSAEAGELLYERTRELILTAEVKSVAQSSSKLLYGPECVTVEVFEKSSSSGGRGDSVAMRLPGARPPAPAKEPQQSQCLPEGVNPELERLCLTLTDDDKTLDERETYAMAFRNTIFNKPGLCVSESVLEAHCVLICNTPPSVSIPILQALRVLSAFHSKVSMELSRDSYLSSFFRLIESTSSPVVLSEALALIVCLLKHTTVSSVLFTESSLELMLGLMHDLCYSSVARQHHNILSSLISILYCITSSSHQLVSLAAGHGLVPTLCQWLTLTTELASFPYHRCLVKHVLSMLVSVSKLPPHQLEVSESLPLDVLNTLLLSAEEMAHPILRLVVPLSAIDDFTWKLHHSQLVKNLFKPTMTSAITRLLLHSLKQNLMPLEAHFPSVENGGEPLLFSSNEVSTFPKASSGVRAYLPDGAKRLKPTTRYEQRSSVSVLHPHVLWSQREATVLLAVQLRGCSEMTTTSVFSDTAVEFKTRVCEQEYHFKIEVYASIQLQACSMTVAGSEVLLKLVKAVSEVWPRLTQEHQKPVHVSIDFDRWEDKEIGILGANDWKVQWSAPDTARKQLSINPVLPGPELESGSETDSDNDEEEEEGEVWEDNLDIDMELGDY